MSETVQDMSRKISAVSKLKAVVHVMKVMAASQIKKCEKAILSSQNYYKNIEKALYACLKLGSKTIAEKTKIDSLPMIAIVFGTDQGLVGSFNILLANHVGSFLKDVKEKKIFVIGERIQESLGELGIQAEKTYSVPFSINGIPHLIHEILSDIQTLLCQDRSWECLVFHNRPSVGSSYEPGNTRILPLDETWKKNLMHMVWPTKQLPEILEKEDTLLFSLLNEYLFTILSCASAESMACENVSRFVAMQHAEKNIEETLLDLQRRFNLSRQTTIDSELFDIISGFSVISGRL